MKDKEQCDKIDNAFNIDKLLYVLWKFLAQYLKLFFITQQPNSHNVPRWLIPCLVQLNAFPIVPIVWRKQLYQEKWFTLASCNQRFFLSIKLFLLLLPSFYNLINCSRKAFTNFIFCRGWKLAVLLLLFLIACKAVFTSLVFEVTTFLPNMENENQQLFVIDFSTVGKNM